MQRLGAYDLVSELGRGAMGVVYKARHRPTGALRAVKVIALDAQDPELAQRFQRETATLARVDGHPNVVRIHETGVEGAHAYYAMELVEGRPLRERIKQGPLPLEDVLDLGAKLARAIAHCHARDVVHRDVKPENVLVGTDGEPRLVDFGLVRDLTSKLTRTGTWIGTPAYMASEQVNGGKATPLTDVYALGVLLYEMLVGQHPYSARTVQDICNQIVRGEHVPLESRRPDLPSALTVLVKSCLSPVPAQRPPSAAELARRLDAIAQQQRKGTAVTAATVRRWENAFRGLVAIAVALVLAIAGLIGWRKAQEWRAQREATERSATIAQSVPGWLHLTRSRMSAGAPDAMLAARTALVLAEAGPSPPATLAEARATAALAASTFGTDDDALALASRALELLPKDGAPTEAMRAVQARAYDASGDATKALAALEGVESLEARRLRARILLDAQRWSDVLSSTSDKDDAYLRGAREWARHQKGVGNRASSETTVRSLGPAASEFLVGLEAEGLVEKLQKYAEHFESPTTVETEIDGAWRDLSSAINRLDAILALSPAQKRRVDVTNVPPMVELMLDRMTLVPERFAPRVNGEVQYAQTAQVVFALERIAAAALGRGSERFTRIWVVASWILARIPRYDDDPERREKASALADKLPRELQYFARDLAFKKHFDDAILGRTSMAALLDHVESMLELPTPYDKTREMFDPMVRYHRVAAEIATRLGAFAEDPAERTKYFARAADHVRRGRERRHDPTTDAHDLDLAELLLVVARGDLQAADALTNRITFGKVDGSDGKETVVGETPDFFLRGEIARRRGDLATARRLLDYAVGVARIEKKKNDSLKWRWSYTSALCAYALVLMDEPSRTSQAKKLLDEAASEHLVAPAYPWLLRELAARKGK